MENNKTKQDVLEEILLYAEKELCVHGLFAKYMNNRGDYGGCYGCDMTDRECPAFYNLGEFNTKQLLSTREILYRLDSGEELGSYPYKFTGFKK